jgi:hypothetical protein
LAVRSECLLDSASTTCCCMLNNLVLSCMAAECRCALSYLSYFKKDVSYMRSALQYAGRVLSGDLRHVSCHRLLFLMGSAVSATLSCASFSEGLCSCICCVGGTQICHRQGGLNARGLLQHFAHSA